MTTASIRAQLAARGIVGEPPSGCRWCGIDQREHARQWKPPVGWHQWTQPTQAMILERMRRRRGNRKNAAPALYHAVTGWAADHTGESGEPDGR